jgi:hydrogenase maturation protein HypF
MAKSALAIRVRGCVQGVGFRPSVWRLAKELGLSGDVRNDAEGVLIRAAGGESALARFVARLGAEPPPLARIESIETEPLGVPLPHGFRIVESAKGVVRTRVVPDTAPCPACRAEIADASERRFGYAFTNCTHCGPRLAILRAVPYDRAATTMASFPLCESCRAEYGDPADRRFHAEPIACPNCGPRPRLLGADGHGVLAEGRDALVQAAILLSQGAILAVKGIGGFQLACDARNAAAVARLRMGKRRERKPFALMARDLSVIGRYCRPNAAETMLLASPQAPIVIMAMLGDAKLPEDVAPGLDTLGFMLPSTPLHQVLLTTIDGPLVMTSGNLSGEPQIIVDAEAFDRLGAIVDAVLTHDRAIAVRIDDSVVRVIDGAPRSYRRARGYAPSPLVLPGEFAEAPAILALGGELKNSFCLIKDGAAILSQHIGDIESAATFDDFRANLRFYAELFDHDPVALAVDRHPEYLPSKYGRESASGKSLRLIEVGHHHAHAAACLAEHGRSLAAPPVLAIVLDGLGWGDDDSLWGGEFLLADYRTARRLAHFKPIAMPGGAVAAKEPWRNLYAHLVAAGISAPFPALVGKPIAMLDRMISGSVNAPLASSCGRLFDAVAASLGICADRQDHEGEAATRLESLACPRTLREEEEGRAYLFDISAPEALWRAIIADLAASVPAPVIAARFHKGLALSLLAVARRLSASSEGMGFDTVVLSGGCFQNAVLLGQTARRLREAGFAVLIPSNVPMNDGGLALGQAVIAATRLLDDGAVFRFGGRAATAAN